MKIIYRIISAGGKEVLSSQLCTDPVEDDWEQILLNLIQKLRVEYGTLATIELSLIHESV